MLRRARALAGLLAVLSLPAAVPAAASAGSPLDRSGEALAAAVAPMLRERAAAFLRHDVSAFMATVDPADSGFARRQRALVTNAGGVDLTSYSLNARTGDVGDLSRPRDRERFGDDTVVLYVREDYALAGRYDEPGPATEDLYLTMTRDRAGRWRVAADDALEDAGLLSGRHPWDFAPVRTRSSPHFLAIYPQNRTADAAKVLEEAEAALGVVLREWTPPWNTQVAIELPKDTATLGERIQATFPLDDFVAFAYAGGDQDGTRFRYVGRRVLINPGNFLGNDTRTRRSILSHELVHIASRETSGVYITGWVEEGVAQLLGEGASAVGVGPARDAVRDGRFTGRLPEDYQFVVGGTQRIFQSYAESYLVAREIERIAGRSGLIRFYVAAGAGGRLGPGTSRYHLDRAARSALGISLSELERRWAAGVRAGRF